MRYLPFQSGAMDNLQISKLSDVEGAINLVQRG